MNTYDIKDLYLAAFMVASGQSIVKHERNAEVSVFSFNKTPQVIELANSYYGFSATVNPITFASACKNLKNIMYQTNQTTLKSDGTITPQYRRV